MSAKSVAPALLGRGENHRCGDRNIHVKHTCFRPVTVGGHPAINETTKSLCQEGPRSRALVRRLTYNLNLWAIQLSLKRSLITVSLICLQNLTYTQLKRFRRNRFPHITFSLTTTIAADVVWLSHQWISFITLCHNERWISVVYHLRPVRQMNRWMI